MIATQPSTPATVREARVAFQPVEHHSGAQRKDQEDEHRQQVPREPPKQPVVRKIGIVDRFARCPWNDRLRHRSADLVDLPGDDPAGSRIVAAADHVDVAVDGSRDRGVAEDHRKIAVDNLARLDDDRTEVGAAVVDGAGVGQRRGGQEYQSAQHEQGNGEKSVFHGRGPLAR